MKKYIIKEKQISYGYRVVEAESVDEALKITPIFGDSKVTDSGYFQNEDIKELNGEKFIYCTENEFHLIKNKKEFQDKWEEEHRWKPYLDEINNS